MDPISYILLYYNVFTTILCEYIPAFLLGAYLLLTLHI